ncbi:hypothetical protein [Arthrobacter sp. SLBN-122]|uniref:hypothetical protein n=1 Tax=Arthrobacter sp. SLBN-122 TaxID=2768455 RepID=UPI001150C105|nr:hypothetical protein [Arthrobacter sp. SLBN-122]
MGSSVGGGLAGVDDGGGAAGVVGATELPGVVVGFPDVVGVAVVLGEALLVVGLGAAELVEGAGLGGPKHPVRTSRLLSPRMLSAESLGLVMVPP